jgi:hypothetical protein
VHRSQCAKGWTRAPTRVHSPQTRPASAHGGSVLPSSTCSDRSSNEIYRGSTKRHAGGDPVTSSATADMRATNERVRDRATNTIATEPSA